MPRLFGKFFSRLFHWRKESQKPIIELRPNETQEHSTDNNAHHDPPNLADQAIQSTQTLQPRDLWQAAYDQLDKSQQNMLSIKEISFTPDEGEKHLKDLIDQVITTTKEGYEKYYQTADKTFRKTSRKVLDAALSFKDIISAVAALEPTQHAASVWNVISFSLTLAKKYSQSRDSLFESSEYLADVLTYGAFVEQNFHETTKNISDTRLVEDALIRLYKAILCYVVQIRKFQKASIGERVLNTVTDSLQQPLVALKTSVENERANLDNWIGPIQHLRYAEKAEEILHEIYEVADSIKQLNLLYAEGASFDSYTQQHEDDCLPNTRTDLLNRISTWAQSQDQLIFWLNGMAGTGKSTIARTVARSFQNQGLLGATFFFKRGEADRGNSRRFISTLTQQLMHQYPKLKKEVLHAVKNNSEIMTKSLNTQFEELLDRPLRKLCPDQFPTTVIVIDALDECDGYDEQSLVLRLLFKIQKIGFLRVFLTSRPEDSIRLAFKGNQNHRSLILHEFQKPSIKHDISVYLECRLAIIQSERSLPHGWPGNDRREKLLELANPSFIFAATLCRFIGDRNWLPDRRLTAVLDDKAVTAASEMHRTYIPVLNQLITGSERDIRQLLQEFRDIIGLITLLATPLSVTTLAQLISTPENIISNRLNQFHAVLHVPFDPTEPVQTLHSSFRDFIVGTETRFRIHEQETHEKIGFHCLQLMQVRLRQNICRLEGYGTEYKNVADHIIKQYLTEDLHYACRYWVHHLQQSRSPLAGCDILAFLSKHFLHWLEALAWTKNISEAVEMIDILLSIKWGTNTRPVLDFLYDAKRFTMQNTYILGLAPLQVYCCALVFAPAQSLMRKNFSHELGKRLRVLPVTEDSWGPRLGTLTGHTNFVVSTAFSPDGHTLASGSSDETIKLWDVTKGHVLETLPDHSDDVTSVVFSPDGRTLASGSSDKTIKLWSTTDWNCLKTLEEHSKEVKSIAFSPDGRTLASGSSDRTIKLWSTTEWNCLKTLEEHSKEVKSIAFSPDGHTLASGSSDGTIKLWSTTEWNCLRTLAEHSEEVNSIAFSPDGRTLASGSSDGTIKLWSTTERKCLKTLADHSEINSIAFSPCGSILASGLDNGDVGNAVHLWNIASHETLQYLTDHASWVGSVTFSPDGRTLASGSGDNNVILWDPEMKTPRQSPQSHLGTVSLVALSPDSRTLASVSEKNHTIQLWDTATSKRGRTLEGHSKGINSIVFSPDGHVLASGSDDCMIKTWNLATEEPPKTVNGRSGPVKSVAFSTDCTVLASGSNDNTVKLWDAVTGRFLRTLGKHPCYVDSLAFSPKSNILASISVDKTIKIWDATSGTLEQEIKIKGGPWSGLMTFSPDGCSLLLDDEEITTELGKPATPKSGVSTDFNSNEPVPNLRVSDEWIVLGREKILWVPPEYDLKKSHKKSQAIKQSTVAFGCKNGRVIILGFHV